MADISNNALAKLISLEVLLPALGLMFVVGVAYNDLHAEDTALHKKAEELERQNMETEQRQRAIETSVNAISLQQGVILKEQQFTQRVIEEIKDEQRRQRMLQEETLRRLGGSVNLNGYPENE